MLGGINVLKYYTKYKIKDCVSILKGKNIYDVFDYKIDFDLNETKATIIFTGCNTHMCRDIRTRYEMSFVEADEGTVIEMVFKNELYILPFPCIPVMWIDEFIEIKLDAKRQ